MNIQCKINNQNNCKNMNDYIMESHLEISTAIWSYLFHIPPQRSMNNQLEMLRKKSYRQFWFWHWFPYLRKSMEMLKEISHACGLAWGGWNTFERLKKVAMHIFMNNLSNFSKLCFKYIILLAQIHIRNTCSFLARNSIGVIEHKSTHTMTYPFVLAFQSPRNESCFRFHIDQNNSEDFKYPPTSQLWLNLLLCGALSLLWIPTGFILVVSKPNSKLSEVCGWYYRIDSSYNSLTLLW